MSTKAEWAELFESVHGRKPIPQEFLDAQVASVQEPANEPVAEEVPAEQADVAETAEGAVTEQASSESPFGTAAFSEAPAQQLIPQFDSSMFEKGYIPTA